MNDCTLTEILSLFDIEPDEADEVAVAAILDFVSMRDHQDSEEINTIIAFLCTA